MAHALQPSSGAPETTPALVVSAPVGLVLAANGAFCAHTGYVENDILGRPLHTLQPMRMSGSLIAALQAQQAGSGFSVHEVPLRLRNGAEERATIRASPLYCIETGALQGFSLLVLASSPIKSGDAAVEYASPAMPAASVEGLRNVAPSVLRLLQICARTPPPVGGRPRGGLGGEHRPSDADDGAGDGAGAGGEPEAPPSGGATRAPTRRRGPPTTMARAMPPLNNTAARSSNTRARAGVGAATTTMSTTARRGVRCRRRSR